MDEDLKNKPCDELIAEIEKLRDGIRKHRDSSGHDLCWYHPDLWNLLPEKYDPKISVPDWPQFMEGCIRFRKSLDEQLPDAKRINEAFEPLSKTQNVLWQSTDGIGLEYLQLSNEQHEIYIDSILICVIDGKPARITYQIRCNNNWQFQKLDLTVDTGTKRTLSLELTPAGQWLNESGKILEELEECLEPDILLTGFTNTMPIRRLNLRKGQSAEIKVAYISIPQLTIVPVKQRYTYLKQTQNGILFHYENLDSGFETDITVDGDFLVIDYPQLFRRVGIKTQ